MLQPKKKPINSEIKNSDVFYKEYLNSPKYKERLLKQGYNSPDKVINDRKLQSSKTKINEIPYLGQFTSKNTGSYFFPENNTIDYDAFDLKLYPGSNKEDIITHERSHSIGALKYKKNNNLTLNENETKNINSRNKIKTEHEKNAWEAKADMDVLRYHLKKDNIYDTGTQDFTPELLNKSKNKYKDNTTIKRFLDRFSDKDAIYLMNNIAMNNEQKNDQVISAYGGEINTNMSRYTQGGDLTQFNEGGLHSQNPLGGVPIGNNNSVEQGETKQNNFIYSNRIFLDENTVSQYNLPKSLVGKSVADATKFIDNKFKGRNDKISQSTKNGMLSKIAEAQEAMKPQEPEIVQQEGIDPQSSEMMGDPSQMALGGYLNKMTLGGFEQYNTIDPNAGVGYKYDPTTSLTPTINTNDYTSHLNNQSSVNNVNNQDKYINAASALARPIADSIYSNGDEKRSNNIQSINTIGQGVGSAVGGAAGSNISKGVTAATGLYEMGSEAFGKSNVNTSGVQSLKGASAGKSAGSGALKGAGTGASIGSIIPGVGTAIGAGVGALVGGITGFIGGKKDEKAQALNNDRYVLNANKQLSDNYFALGGEIKPTKITTQALQNTTILPNTNPVVQSDRFRYAVGEQGGVQSGPLGTPGHYLYYDKKPGQPGFNPAIHREFVNQGGYDTYMRSPQGQQYRRNLSAKSLQPIEQLGYGGKVRKMADGGFADNPFDEYSKRTLPQLNLQPINQVIPSFINKGTSINNAQAVIGTKVDGDFGKNSKLALDKYRQSKGMSNVGQPLSNVDYTAMGLTSDGYKINKNAFRQQLPENLNLKLDSPIEGFNKYTGIENNVEAGKDKKSLAGKGLSYVNDNLGNIARYAPIAANALQLAQLKKPQGERLDRLSNRYKPEYVDEAALQNIADQNMNNTVSAISQSGASQGQTRASVLGSQLQRTKALSDAYSNAAAQNRATNDRGQQFNLGVDQVNLNQSNTEKDINARDQAAYRNAKREYITGIGEGIGDIGKEQTYKKIIAKTTGYKWDGEYVKSPDGTVVTDPLTGKPMTEEKLKELQSTKDKKALGGYLIKNKRQ